MGKKTTGEEEEEKENEKEEEERKPSTFAGNGSTDEDKKQDDKRSYVEGTEKQTEGYRADSSTNTATLQQDVACAVAASRRGNSANSKGAARSEHENAADDFGKTDTAAAYHLKDDTTAADDDDEIPLHLRSGFGPAAASNSNNSNNNGGAGRGRRATATSLPPGAYHVQPGMSATRRDSVDMMDISDGSGGSNSGSGNIQSNLNAAAGPRNTSGNGTAATAGHGHGHTIQDIHASDPTVISALTFNVAHVENGGNNNHHNNAGSSDINGDPAVEAYAVTPDEEATQAVVLDTVCGVERKRFVAMGCAALLVLAIVLAFAIPISQRNAANANGAAEKVCGPICGADVLQPPHLDRVVLGKSCGEWNRISLDTPSGTTDKNDDDGSTTESDSIITKFNSSCDALFQLVAYGCGCPSSDTTAAVSSVSASSSGGTGSSRATGCGMLCYVDPSSKQTKEAPFDPSFVIGPMKHFTEKILMDGYNTSIKSGLLEAGASTTFTCGDWELLSLFETDDEKCPAYNALGYLCGCESNQPHPDACGPLCDGGDEFVFNSQTNIYGATCEDWDKLSRFLPSWYGNPNDEETCEEHYLDVKYGCACPESRKPPPFENEPQCGALCQQLRTCPPICGEGGDSAEGGRQGSQMVDPSKTVQRESCYGWELLSRVSPDPNLCPFYRMMGAQCGCDVEEPENSFSNICGAFCGGDIENIPDIGRMVAGETCGDWYYKSTYLPVSHGSQITDFVFNKLEGCDEIKRIQFGCGCNNVEPPEESCGRLCGEDSELPDPSRIVGGRPCGDWEMLSLFESDLETCDKYHVVQGTCGCNDIEEYPYPCFEYEQLADRTWYYGGGGNFQFYFDFTEDGHFGLVVNSNQLFTNVVGFFQGWGSGHAENVVAFGGGVFCGANGPATALVNIVEDETVAEPKIAVVNEPAICTYHAEMRVPKFCEPRGEEL